MFLITFFSVNERPPKSLYAVNVNVYAPPAVNSISGFWLAADVPFTNLNVVGKMLQIYLSAKSVVVVIEHLKIVFFPMLYLPNQSKKQHID